MKTRVSWRIGANGWWYPLVILFVVQAASLGLTLTVVLKLADRSVEAERQARVQSEQQAAEQREVGRRVTCALVVAQDNVYLDTPPISKAGENAAKAWHALREQFQCDKG